MKLFNSLFLIILFTTLNMSVIQAQSREEINFRSPLDIPLYLSGNFSELRSNHFHAGIDIKTQSVEGKAVYAVEDGYVARIKISTSGYGKAIYISEFQKTISPNSMVRNAMTMDAEAQQTLAPGEMQVSARVNVSFELN